jgi:hypothetical protein
MLCCLTPLWRRPPAEPATAFRPPQHAFGPLGSDSSSAATPDRQNAARPTAFPLSHSTLRRTPKTPLTSSRRMSTTGVTQLHLRSGHLLTPCPHAPEGAAPHVHRRRARTESHPGRPEGAGHVHCVCETVRALKARGPLVSPSAAQALTALAPHWRRILSPVMSTTMSTNPSKTCSELHFSIRRGRYPGNLARARNVPPWTFVWTLRAHSAPMRTTETKDVCFQTPSGRRLSTSGAGV